MKRTKEVCNFMGHLFTYKDYELTKALLDGMTNACGQDVKISPPLTFVYDRNSFGEFQVLSEETSPNLWGNIDCGCDIVIENFLIPRTDDAVRFIKEASVCTDETLFAVPIILNCDHSNMLIIQKNIAFYFEPHNKESYSDGDERVFGWNRKLPYGRAQSLLSKPPFNLSFHISSLDVSKYRWQQYDSLCQSWAHWYMALRTKGVDHETTAAYMHQKGIAGLIKFVTHCFTKVPIVLKRKEFFSISFMVQHRVKDVMSVLSAAEHYPVFTYRTPLPRSSH